MNEAPLPALSRFCGRPVPSPFATITLPRRHRLKDPEKTPLKKALAIFLIVGFLLVDFLFFHDLLKPGETITFAQYLTGALSVPVIVLAALYLAGGNKDTPVIPR